MSKYRRPHRQRRPVPSIKRVVPPPTPFQKWLRRVNRQITLAARAMADMGQAMVKAVNEFAESLSKVSQPPKFADGECLTCGELEDAEGECPESQRQCGHHCNCSWIHDHCHWCGEEWEGE